MAYGLQTYVYSIYGQAEMPDTNIGYTYDDVLAAFNTLGTEGLSAWSLIHLLDLIFPIGYCFALVIGTGILLKRAFPEKQTLRLLTVLPFLGAILDYVENALIASQIASYPVLSVEIISIASIITTVKYGFIYVSFGVVFILLLVSIAKRIRPE
jgi:hypothetical protein